MAYMSYCRMEGTRQELRYCLEDAMDHYSEVAEDEVSDREISQFRNMVNEFVVWLQDMELLTEDGELDHDQLEEVCKAMAKGYTEDDEEGEW